MFKFFLKHAIGNAIRHWCSRTKLTNKLPIIAERWKCTFVFVSMIMSLSRIS